MGTVFQWQKSKGTSTLGFALSSYSGNVWRQRRLFVKHIKVYWQRQSLWLGKSHPGCQLPSMGSPVMGEVLPLNVDFKSGKLQQAGFRWLLGFIKCFLVDYTVWSLCLVLTAWSCICHPGIGRSPISTKERFAASQSCQCSPSPTSCVVQESVVHLLMGHKTAVASPDIHEFEYLGYKIKGDLAVTRCSKGECQPSCTASLLLVKHFTKCFMIHVRAPGAMPSRCFLGYSVIHTTIWPNWLKCWYPGITIIQNIKEKAEHFSSGPAMLHQTLFRIVLQPDWYIPLLNKTERQILGGPVVHHGYIHMVTWSLWFSLFEIS